MRTVLLHGLGQTAQDWGGVTALIPSCDIDCPELFVSTGDELVYSRIRDELERRYADAAEPLCICGLSLGALFAMDFAIRHGDRVASLILIGAQYKIPRLIIDLQNLLFRCMPRAAFKGMGVSKSDVIGLAQSIRSLDFTPHLHRIACPTAILCGEKDKANLKASRELSELLPQATLHIVPKAGHELNREAPDAIAKVLLKNCNRHATA